MTEPDRDEVSDNPEWSEEDIKAGRRLSDFEPKLAAHIARNLERRMREPLAKRVKSPPAKPRGQHG